MLTSRFSLRVRIYVGYGKTICRDAITVWRANAHQIERQARLANRISVRRTLPIYTRFKQNTRGNGEKIGYCGWNGLSWLAKVFQVRSWEMLYLTTCVAVTFWWRDCGQVG